MNWMESFRLHDYSIPFPLSMTFTYNRTKANPSPDDWLKCVLSSAWSGPSGAVSMMKDARRSISSFERSKVPFRIRTPSLNSTWTSVIARGCIGKNNWKKAGNTMPSNECNWCVPSTYPLFLLMQSSLLQNDRSYCWYCALWISDWSLTATSVPCASGRWCGNGQNNSGRESSASVGSGSVQYANCPYVCSSESMLTRFSVFLGSRRDL